eukprot:2759024-Pyramimonas_sp.AAC.1
MDPTVLQASSFIQQVDGIIRVAQGGAGTCASKNAPDSLLDYMVCSQYALPFVEDLTVVRDVSWKPH